MFNNILNDIELTPHTQDIKLKKTTEILKKFLENNNEPSDPCHIKHHSKFGCGPGGCGYIKSHKNTCN